ncbi:MAG: hypothetical protein AAF502_14655 [Bacteroidota bacterium]
MISKPQLLRKQNNKRVVRLKTYFVFLLSLFCLSTLFSQRQAVYQYSTTNPYRLLYSLDNQKYAEDWKVDKVAFFAFSEPVSGTVPIYQYHADKPMRFLYSTDPNIDAGWTRDGVAFYAHNGQQKGTFPIYEFAASNPMRFLYSPSYNNGKGWEKSRISFWAYLEKAPKVEVIAESSKPKVTTDVDHEVIVEWSQPEEVKPESITEVKTPLETNPELIVEWSQPEEVKPESVTEARTKVTSPPNRSFTPKGPVSISNDKPASIPVFEFTAPQPTRYNYSKIEKPDEGWEKVSIAFHAYKYKEKGTVPIYRYYAKNPWRFYYSSNPDMVNENSTWQKDWIAFYAYTAQMPGSIPIYEYYEENPLRYIYSTDPNLKKEGWTLNGVVFYGLPNP